MHFMDWSSAEGLNLHVVMVHQCASWVKKKADVGGLDFMCCKFYTNKNKYKNKLVLSYNMQFNQGHSLKVVFK